MRDFGKADFKNKLLIIWLDKNTTEENFHALATEADSLGGAVNRIAIARSNGAQIFSPAALRKGTHFITTREMTTLAALDYLWDTNVKIVSALDDDIFSS